MAHDQSDLLQGTLELLVLKTLSLEPMHGWGISQRIQQMSRDVFQVNQGSLYPALQRMKSRGWIGSEWRTTENNRRAKYYMLTPAGECELARERSQWERSSAAVNWVLDWAGGAP
ncbi:MAG TPA: PadR family transcriptional regulator [Longimicrobiaceae bacterium]|nr:PadR family transcriptional regulator [Longimicrobiaceae bacterium]